MERVCRGIYVFGHGLLSRSCVVTHLDSFVILGILEMAILKIGLVSLFDLSMRGAQSWQRTPKSNMLNSSLDHLVLEYFLLYPIYRQALCKFFCYSSKCVLFSYMSIGGGAVINWPAISISVWYFLLFQYVINGQGYLILWKLLGWKVTFFLKLILENTHSL